MKIKKTDTRKAYTLHIGQFEAQRTFTYCADCGITYRPEDFDTMIPEYSNIGYDVMIFVGMKIFRSHQTLAEVQAALKEKNIGISKSEISYLALKFVVYLSLLHKNASGRIKGHLNDNGGYILHIDGTSEGGSPHLITVIDEVSNIVLSNEKCPAESKEQVLPILYKIKDAFGIPLSVVSDMGKAFVTAIPEVFPLVKYSICHFHFLRDIGKDLMLSDYTIIGKTLQYLGISKKLRSRLNYYFDDDEIKNIDPNTLNELLDSTSGVNKPNESNVMKLLYLLIHWVLDGKKVGNGYGFPFDRPNQVFYERACDFYKTLKYIKKRNKQNPEVLKIIGKIIDDIEPLTTHTECKVAYKSLSKKAMVFEDLRDALAIAPVDATKGLNDEGKDLPIGDIEKRVIAFKHKLQKQKPFALEYQKLIEQLDKYWEMLFCAPIKVSTSEGVKIIQPQRTNNILEQYFRAFKRNHRRTTGNNSMCKKLETMIADTPLIKNLDNPEYMKALLNGKATLEECFAEIPPDEVRKKMDEETEDDRKVPRKLLKILREKRIMEKILSSVAC